MRVTPTSTGDEAGDFSRVADMEPSSAARAPLVVPAGGERCVTCEAPLASDQRYCLNCGQRRGRSRFSHVASPASAAASPPAPSTEAERPRRRLSSGATLVAGIATLLLAMGVGVEIGRIGNSGQQRASSPGVQVVTVAGAGGGASAGPSTTAASSNAGSSKSHGKTKGGKAQPKVVHITQKVQAQAASNAKKVLGASSANLAPPTVQPGQSCTHGAGCQNGQFTGNFFGP